MTSVDAIACSIDMLSYIENTGLKEGIRDYWVRLFNRKCGEVDGYCVGLQNCEVIIFGKA